jgi:hypothetical protein
MRRMPMTIALAFAMLLVSSVAYAQTESEAPIETEAPAVEASLDPPASLDPEASPDPALVDGEPRVIEIEADALLRFLQEGEQVLEIGVTPGETVLFRIDNTAGFAHNFWIGLDEEVNLPNAATDIGIPDWDSGIAELEWVVPEDITDLRFSCTVPGHYLLMQGDFVVTP